MNLNKNNISTLIGFFIFGIIIGSLGWEICEQVLRKLGIVFSLKMQEPIGLNLYVIEIYLRFNLGSILGGVGNIILFKIL